MKLLDYEITIPFDGLIILLINRNNSDQNSTLQFCYGKCRQDFTRTKQSRKPIWMIWELCLLNVQFSSGITLWLCCPFFELKGRLGGCYWNHMLSFRLTVFFRRHSRVFMICLRLQVSCPMMKNHLYVSVGLGLKNTLKILICHCFRYKSEIFQNMIC